jgi:hypothetical protein
MYFSSKLLSDTLKGCQTTLRSFLLELELELELEPGEVDQASLLGAQDQNLAGGLHRILQVRFDVY